MSGVRRRFSVFFGVMCMFALCICAFSSRAYATTTNGEASDGADAVTADAGTTQGTAKDDNPYADMEVPDDAVELENGYLMWTLEDGTVVVKAPSEDPQKKTRTPVVTKTVYDEASSEWAKITDATVGHDVSFRLDGTVPEELDAYKTYHYEFVDTLCEGMTVNFDSVKVTRISKDGSETDVTKMFKLDTSKAGVMSLLCEDLKKVEGISDTDILRVSYTARLNEKMLVGLAKTNDNFVKIVHSFWVRDGRTTESREDKASVVTFKLDVTKVAKDSGKTLSGAVFTISDAKGNYLKSDSTWGDAASAMKLTSSSNGTFEVKGLGAGDYVLHEVTAPSGYQAVGDVKLNVSLSKNSDGTYKLVATCAGATVTKTDAGAGEVSVKVEDTSTPPNDSKKTTPKETMPATGAQIARVVAFIGIGVLFVAGAIVLFKRSKDDDGSEE